MTWYRPSTLAQVLSLKSDNADKITRLVVGNTSSGVYGPDETSQVRQRGCFLFCAEFGWKVGGWCRPKLGAFAGDGLTTDRSVMM